MYNRQLQRYSTWGILEIYVHRWSLEEVDKFLTAQKYRLRCQTIMDIEEFPTNNGVQCTRGYVQADQGPRTVQVMVMNESEFPSQVVNSFDLSYLMNFYDGKFIYMKNPIDVVRRTGTYNQVSDKNIHAS